MSKAAKICLISILSGVLFVCGNVVAEATSIQNGTHFADRIGIEVNLVDKNPHEAYISAKSILDSPKQFLGDQIIVSGMAMTYEYKGREYHGCQIRDIDGSYVVFEYILSDIYSEYPEDETENIGVKGNLFSYEEDGVRYYALMDAILF